LKNIPFGIFLYPVTKGERTRQQIIEVTAPIFNTKGYEGTSMADLCQATGLTKGAIYGSFENKEELSKATFLYAIRQMRSVGNEGMRGKETYKEKLIALLEFFTRYVLDPPVKGGCPLLNTAVEADDHRIEMKKMVTDELQHSITHMTQLMDRGKKAGEFSAAMKSRETALFFFCAIEGAIMFSRVSSSEEAMKAVVSNIKNILDSYSLN
jgi:TetR/AcrR family transcriptional regulator, transcriptional repressor for nem operon